MANITSDKRREKFWQRMANKNVKVPIPRTREEILLKAIGDNINRGGSGTVDPADIAEAVDNYFEEHPSSIEPMTKAEMLNILRGGDNV